VHPYTLDPVTAGAVASKTAPASSPFLVPGLLKRVQILEGVVRKDIAGSANGTTSSPDKRIKALEDRVRTIEQYLNSPLSWAAGGGTIPIPTVGAVGVALTPAQALDLGDAIG
jgi:hypothetical protein